MKSTEHSSSHFSNTVPAESPRTNVWPWSEEPEAVCAPSPHPARSPRITVVTPSFNQGAFIEQTIRSVLLQKYPNLEYLVIDGGSTDATIEIIKKYESRITYWTSEPDRGQSHAINKGFETATGDILAWLNSDDMYLPGALHAVAERWLESKCEVLTGHTLFIDEKGRFEGRFDASPMAMDRFLHYVMDGAYWLNMLAANKRWVVIDQDLSLFRHHSEQKTSDLVHNLDMHQERERVLRRFAESELFRNEHALSLTLGLTECWLKQWKIRNFKAGKSLTFPIRWAMVPFQNWHCLRIRAYYGALYYFLTGQLWAEGG